MIGTAYPMKESEALLATARERPLQAIDMVNAFSHAGIASKPPSPAGHVAARQQPRADAAHARLAPAARGAQPLRARLPVCDAYANGLAAAAQVRCLGQTSCSASVIEMTSPHANPRDIAAALNANIVTALPASPARFAPWPCCLTEAPDGVLNAVRQAFAPAALRADHGRPTIWTGDDLTASGDDHRTAGQRRRPADRRWDREARLVFCNPPYLRWSGRTRDELFGHTLTELYGDEAWDRARPVRARLPRRHHQLRSVCCATARWRPLGARAGLPPTPTPTARCASVFTIATDIHEDVTAREALIAARVRLDRFTENIPYPLTYVDSDFLCCASSTRPTARSAGKPAEKLLGRPHRAWCAGAALSSTSRTSAERWRQDGAVHALVDGLANSPAARAGCAPARARLRRRWPVAAL